MTVREVLRRLADDGWVRTSQKGSHRQFEHPVKSGKVTVAGPPSERIAPKTLKSIYRQAGWDWED